MMQREAKRADRVAERIRAELSEMFLRGAVRDPRARGVIVSAVRVTADLSLARIYVRLLDDGLDPRHAIRARHEGSDEPVVPAGPGVRTERQGALLVALESARGHLRRALGGRLGLRRTPELTFHWDDVVDSGMRMEELLMEIAPEAAPAPPTPTDPEEDA